MQRLLILGLLHAASACRIKDDTGAPDEDCSWYVDADRDGYGDVAESTAASCAEQPSVMVDNADDCDDCDDCDHLAYRGLEECCTAGPCHRCVHRSQR